MCVGGGSGDVSLEFEGEASEEPLAEFGTCCLPVGSRERA